MIRRRLDHISTKSDTYRDIEVSLLTICYLEWYYVLTRGSYVLCMRLCAMCYMYVVWCYRPDRRVQRYRPGRRAQRAMTGPEGPTSYGTGGSRWDTSTGGSYYSLEWRMCCMRYFGELTKHLCLQLLCYVFQVLVMSAGRRRHDSYTHALEFL